MDTSLIGCFLSGPRARPRWTLLAALTVAMISLSACGDSASPTAPRFDGVGGFGVTIGFQTNRLSDAQKETIGVLLEETFEQVAGQIQVGGTVITVTSGPRYLIPGWGVGGFAASGMDIEIAVDPALSPAIIEARLPSMVAHELHHVARFRGPGYGGTLLKALVSEGLADRFAEELFGQSLPPWVLALSGSELDRWTEVASAEFDSSSYDHEAWFFGRSMTIPNWAGYAIGYGLVAEYIGAHGGTAASLVHADADLFR